MTETKTTDLGRVGSISADDRPLGEYLVDFRLFTDGIDVTEFSIDVSAAKTLRLHLDNALDSIAQRQFSDLAAGDCDVCSNVRMVNEPRNDHDWLVHCPVCKPKIEAAEAKIRTSWDAR